MSIQMIKDGQEELLRSATNYVTGLGVPARDIHALSVGGTVGGPISIILEIYVDPARVTAKPDLATQEKPWVGDLECDGGCPVTAHLHDEAWARAREAHPSEARTEVFLRVPPDDGSAHPNITR